MLNGRRAERNFPILGAFGALSRLTLAVPVVLWLNVGTATATIEQLPTATFWLAFAFWMVLAALDHRPFLGNFLSLAWPIIGILVLLAIIFAFSGDQGLLAYIYGFAYALLVLGLTAFYRADQFRKERLVLLLVIGGDLLVVGIRTASRLAVDPDVARYMATTEENRVEVYGEQSFAGLGGYGYTYALTAIVIAAVVLALGAHGRRRLSLVILAVVLFGYVAFTGFTLALLLAAAFIAVAIAIYVIRKVDRKLVLPVLGVTALIGVYVAPAPLAYLASSDLFSAAVRMRLIELSNFLQGDLEQTLDLSTRVHFYGESVESFLGSPIFGSLPDAVPTAGLGLHSSWLDLLGLLGLFWILVPIMFWRTLRSLTSGVDGPRNAALRTVWFYFAALGVVNTLLFANIFLMWLFFIPQMLIHASTKPVSSVDSIRHSTEQE